MNERIEQRGFMRTLRGSEAGQAIVEAAITMPFLILLMVGAAEFGRMAFAAIQVSNAAAAAAKYGAQTHATAGDTAGMLTAAQNEYTYNPTALTLTPAPTAACSCSDSGASVSCHDSTVCSGAQIEVSITVRTQASFNPIIHVPGLTPTITLHGWAIQKVLQ